MAHVLSTKSSRIKLVRVVGLSVASLAPLFCVVELFRAVSHVNSFPPLEQYSFPPLEQFFAIIGALVLLFAGFHAIMLICAWIDRTASALYWRFVNGGTDDTKPAIDEWEDLPREVEVRSSEPSAKLPPQVFNGRFSQPQMPDEASAHPAA